MTNPDSSSHGRIDQRSLPHDSTASSSGPPQGIPGFSVDGSASSSNFVFPERFVQGNQNLEVTVLQKYNIAIANGNAQSMGFGFPMGTPPSAYPSEVYRSLVGHYTAALDRVYQTKSGKDLLDVIATGQPTARNPLNQWRYRTEDGSIGLSDVQLVIFPSKATVLDEVHFSVIGVEDLVKSANVGTAAAMVIDVDQLYSTLDEQGREFMIDPFTLFFMNLFTFPKMCSV